MPETVFLWSVTNHSVLCCRILYRQRFFQTVPKLVEHYHRAAEPVRCNFLIALAYMLQGVPRVILTVSLPEVSQHQNVWYHYVRTVATSWLWEIWGLHSSVAEYPCFLGCFFYVMQQLYLGLGCLIVEVSRSHTIRHTHTHARAHVQTPLSEWSAHCKGRYLHNTTSDRRDNHPFPQWDADLCRRPHGCWDRHFWADSY